MKVLATANVLVVGIDSLENFDSLPITAKLAITGLEAISSLKYEDYDAVVSKWNLADMTGGKFIKGLRLIKPKVPVIAVIEAGDYVQEISARACGVKAVVSTEGLMLLKRTLAELLKLPVVEKTVAETAY